MDEIEIVGEIKIVTHRKAKHTLMVILLVLSSPSVFAENLAQVFASVEFIEPNGNAVGQDLVISDVNATMQKGHEHGYPTIICDASTRTFKSTMLFSGYVLEARLDGSNVVFMVKKYAVDVQPMKPYDESAPCSPLMPSQRVLVDQTFRVHIDVSNQVIKLPDGSTMKYSISGLAR